MELTEILMCPKTGNKLRFSAGNSVVHVEDSEITYPLIDGIVDFCPQSNDSVTKSYDKVASRYDAYMTSSNIFMKICNRLIWGFGSDCDYAEPVLSYLPSQFDGVLLDVPVGTGVFTDSLYARFPNATIIAIDYSMGMLQLAKDRLGGLSNVHLIRADVANLPLRNGTADIVLSMNGWHVFKDKQRATVEMKRVLQKNGSLVACGYVKGDRWLSDWFVKHFGIRNGYFNPPFFTKDNIGDQFEGFEISRQGNMKSMVFFEAIKR